VAHDESTLFANDQRKLGWISKLGKENPELKGEGDLIMVSDFLTLEWDGSWMETSIFLCCHPNST
jgi:hypothetical protein